MVALDVVNDGTPRESPLTHKPSDTLNGNSEGSLALLVRPSVSVPLGEEETQS